MCKRAKTAPGNKIKIFVVIDNNNNKKIDKKKQRWRREH